MTRTPKIVSHIRAARAWVQRRHVVVRYGIGGLCIALGIFALITPLTPGAWLAIIGLEFLGIHITLTDKILGWFEKRSDDTHDLQ